MTSVELHCTHVFTDFKPYLYYIIPVVEIMNQTQLESSNTFVQSLLNSPNPNHQVGTKATTAVIFAWTAFCECEEIKPNSKTCKKLASSYQAIIRLCTVIIQSTLKTEFLLLFVCREHFCWLQQHWPMCFTQEARGVRGRRGLQEPHAIPAQKQTESSMYKNNNNLNNNNSTYCTLTLKHICYKHHKWHMIQTGFFSHLWTVTM